MKNAGLVEVRDNLIVFVAFVAATRFFFFFFLGGNLIEIFFSQSGTAKVRVIW